MNQHNSEDKNHLGMLAVPIILSVLIGFGGSGFFNQLSGTRTESLEEGELVDSETRNIEYGTQLGEQNEIAIGSGGGDDNRKKELEKAVLEEDYNRFLTLIDGTSFGEIMTETTFHELVTQYKQYKAGYRFSPFIDQDWS